MLHLKMSASTADTLPSNVSVNHTTLIHYMTSASTIKCGSCGYVIDKENQVYISVHEKMNRISYFHKSGQGCYESDIKDRSNRVRKRQ
jgi:hypothetical protein